MRIRAAALLAIVVPTLVAPAVARDRTIPEATVIGKPRSCVPIYQIRSSHVRSDEIIDFEMRDRKVYRVTLPQGGCPSLGFEEKFSYRTTIGQLCSGDIITVLRTSGPQTGPSCGMSEFVPVTLAKRPR